MKYPTVLAGLCFALITFVPTASAQYEDDTKTVDSTIESLYEVISGDANVERDWDRFRNLFTSNAQLIPIAVQPDSTFPVFYSPEEYIEVAGPYLLSNGFFEKEVARQTEDYGHMVHAFSTYEAFHTSKDTEPFMRGINSIQLMNNGERWFVINIMWEQERPDNQIPGKYLE